MGISFVYEYGYDTQKVKSYVLGIEYWVPILSTHNFWVSNTILGLGIVYGKIPFVIHDIQHLTFNKN